MEEKYELVFVSKSEGFDDVTRHIFNQENAALSDMCSTLMTYISAFASVANQITEQLAQGMVPDKKSMETMRSITMNGTTRICDTAHEMYVWFLALSYLANNANRDRKPPKTYKPSAN